jgi:hypothetical protein
VPRLTLEEFEEHISDRVTAIALGKATGKLTDKQSLSEMADLARWCVDRMKMLSQSDQLKVINSRLFEAIKPKD